MRRGVFAEVVGSRRMVGGATLIFRSFWRIGLEKATGLHLPSVKGSLLSRGQLSPKRSSPHARVLHDCVMWSWSGFCVKVVLLLWNWSCGWSYVEVSWIIWDKRGDGGKVVAYDDLRDFVKANFLKLKWSNEYNSASYRGLRNFVDISWWSTTDIVERVRVLRGAFVQSFLIFSRRAVVWVGDRMLCFAIHLFVSVLV